MDDTRPIAAAALMLGAGAVIGLIDNFIVVVAETHGLWQFHAFRTALALPLIWAVVALGFGSLKVQSFWNVSVRSFFISAAMVIYFGCLAFLPIAEVTAGLFTAPIWVLLISVAFFGRRIGAVRIGASLMGFLGVILVLRPDAGALTPLAALPVLAGILYAINAILTRERCAGENTLALLAGNFIALGLWGLAAMAVLALFPQPVPEGADGFILRAWAHPDGPFLFWVAVQAVGSLLGVGLLIRAYQLAETSFVSVFEFAILLFASIWAWVLRGEGLDVWASLGLAMIIVSGATIALRGR